MHYHKNTAILANHANRREKRSVKNEQECHHIRKKSIPRTLTKGVFTLRQQSSAIKKQRK
jgi:hypothetical protein